MQRKYNFNEIKRYSFVVGRWQMAFDSKSISALASAFVLAISVHAQGPEPKLAGRVTQIDSGSPIEGATVTLLPPFIAGQLNLQTAKTDSNGKYRFERVVAGTYSITASADGFVPQDYKRDASPEGAFVRVDSATSIRDIDFQLAPEAVIRGTVVDVTGKPVADLPVTAVRQDWKITPLHGAVFARTAVNGQFVLKGLPAATYLVCANGPAGYGASSKPGGWYRETWFGGTPSSDGAIPIALKEHDERSDVRIVVEREMRYKVVVWPSGPEGELLPDRYDVMIEHRSHTSMKQADGSYLIPDVPPGHYTLVSTAWLRVQAVGQGEEDFDVSNADVSLHVQLGGLAEIAGAIQWAGVPVEPDGRALFMVESEEGAAQGVRIDGQGHFDISGVLPGKYRFKAFQVNPVAIPRSVQCAGKEVSNDSPLLVRDRDKVSDCKVTLTKP
jgi:hypothetical protein